MSHLTGTLLAFCAGALGALVFGLIGFPAAALTGSAVGVTLAGLAGLRFDLPVWMRTAAFILLGVNIGTGVTPETLQAAASWPLSIAVLGASLPLGLAIAKAGMVRWMGFSQRDAILASAPGHLSYVLSMSLEQGGPTAQIAVIQSIRVLFLTLCVPLLVSVVFGASGATLLPVADMTLISLGLLGLAGLIVGYGYQKLRVPAAFLMAGMTVSALGHVTDLTPGRLSAELGDAAFVVMGTMIGSRFAGQSGAVLRNSVMAGAWLTLVNVITTLMAVTVALVLMGVPPAVLIVAYAPGGVEAMAAIAVTLGLDPAYVAAHHVMRLLILSLLLPIWMARIREG
ncbi:AbrB family transcriptional regulator [Mameliella sp. AT18]|uniref:AbrB family transcriptional regulator n=1 Tax=Mameliella sp. AT18 TaxID=3028385 RepID=UPI0008411BFF|nr:AbrB family transcriptional regulator [Mameliella sp. AT18]MDD9732275.1 AbrB family transcriptional regulator [Mameliella sp. AT18]ODM49030.1 ammonia monooxygenase [Ruegeria sp. PBVC088]